MEHGTVGAVLCSKRQSWHTGLLRDKFGGADLCDESHLRLLADEQC